MVAFAGLMVTDVSAAAPISNVGVEAVGTPTNAAEITTAPRTAPVASPAFVPLAIIVAADVLELHVTDEVTSCVVPSVNVPVAVNCCLVPSGQLAIVDGLMAIELSAAAVMFTKALPLTVPSVAVTVGVPTAAAVMIPWLPEALLAVALGEFEVHET